MMEGRRTKLGISDFRKGVFAKMIYLVTKISLLLTSILDLFFGSVVHTQISVTLLYNQY